MEDIMVSEMSQVHEDKCHMFSIISRHLKVDLRQ
jgi:hypothetical protein